MRQRRKIITDNNTEKQKKISISDRQEKNIQIIRQTININTYNQTHKQSKYR